MAGINLANRFITELAQYAQPIHVIDIGSYPIHGQVEVYSPLLPLSEYKLLTLTAFDPQQAVCDFINQYWSPMAKAYPYAISDGGVHTLYKTANPLCYSLFKPLEEFLIAFESSRKYFEIEGTEELQTRSLDELTEEIQGIDFIKLDAQGAELDILQHATKWLDNILVVHCEVEFIELYENQPMFEDIAQFMRKNNFQLHRFEPLFVKNFSPYDLETVQPTDQYYYADAVYVRNWNSFKHCSPVQLLKIAIIFHFCYSSRSLSALALRHYQAKVPSTDLYDLYLQSTLPAAPTS